MTKASLCGLVVLSLVFGPAEGRGEPVHDYLSLLASRLSQQCQPPASAAEWQASRPSVLHKYLEIIGLEPLPAKDALNPRFVGSMDDLEDCLFRRVVFESRAKNYVAAHLYLPKGVSFPVPAVIYVPGHTRTPNARDGFTHHPHTYAAAGLVALALPQLGDEGKRDAAIPDLAGSHRWHHQGPHNGHNEWLNTGYTGIGPEVWDTIRAVDYLLSLTVGDVMGTSDTTPLVKTTGDGSPLIGVAGRSGGAARALWAAAADPRIRVVVATQGYTAIEGYDQSINYTCDVHLFYNYFGLCYGELYGLIAPRPLLVQHGTSDYLYRNPTPVTTFLTALYGAQDASDQFLFKTYAVGHEDTAALRSDETAWLNIWLRDVKEPMADKSSIAADKACFKSTDADVILVDQGPEDHYAPQDTVSTIDQYTPARPEWVVPSLSDFDPFKATLMGALREKIIRTAFQPIPAELLVDGEQQTFSGYNLEQKSLVIEGVLRHKAYFFSQPSGRHRTVVRLSQTALSLNTLKSMYEQYFLERGLNLFVLELTGVGTTALAAGNYTIFINRFAMLVGHTITSLCINDALAAVRAVAQEPTVDREGIYLWGTADSAVPALYAAVVDETIAGVLLESMPARHTSATALFLISKYADLPRVLGLFYPRRVVLAGTIPTELDWAQNLYSALGSGKQLIESKGNVGVLLDRLADTQAAVSDAPSGQTCVDMGGTCCPSGAICQDGAFSPSLDCDSLCCVAGGVCVDPSHANDIPQADSLPSSNGSADRPASLSGGCAYVSGLSVRGWALVLLLLVCYRLRRIRIGRPLRAFG